MSAELSWKPRRRGSIYCAPACGSNCTRAAYEKAVEDGKKLATRLGKKWKSRVWENMGWHHEAHRGPIVVTQHGAFFHCLISDREGSVGGLGVWTPEKNWARSPRAAVRVAMDGVRMYAEYIRQAAMQAELAARED